ncbi:MAG: hypothetical protein GY699_19830, partial [Desulfobacteraceae bacterium]|nr:hypothetical protein [Desulfobacteraceae bacterium]
MKRISTGNSIIQSICWIGILLLSIFLLSTTAYAGLRDGLIAHYPFNGNPNDVGPNGYHGTENGGVSLTDDRMNNLNSAYNFDGYDGYIKTGKFQLPSVFSVSMWINAKDTLDGQMFLGKLNAALGTPVMLGFADGGYGVWVGYEFYADGDKTTGWQHLAVVVEKTGTPQNRVRFYKNGKLLWSRNQFAPIEDTSAGAMAIGAALPNGIAISYFIGEIDDVRIYDRTLSQTEIELLFDPTQGLDITSDNDIDGEDLNYFAESLGQIRWYRDQDKDSYSDGTSIWGPNRPDDDYYREDELKSISGDCDDSNPAINPGATGTLCPPFGSCCYTVDENCVPVYHCDDNVSERVCINELYGTFNKDTLCSNLTPDECPMGNDLGACCQTMVSGGITTAVCNDNLTETKCDDNSGSFFSNVECSDLTPEECPLPEPTGSCCHPKISYVNEDGVFPVQCLDNLTEYKCKLLQGTWDETQACADLDETECPPFGACCYDDGGTTKCANWMLES